MEFLEQFKTFLLQGKENPSKITVKNYVADVRKFIRWFETRFARVFVPRLVTPEVVTDYKTQLNGLNSQTTVAAARSLKRYLSSLRKFYQFLQTQGVVGNNPFDLTPPTNKLETDIWHLKEFTNFLFLSHASKPTIKNYLADVKQFITWFEQVTSHLGALQGARSAIERIDGSLIEDYKTRLLYDAKFEARSVNRKLSSLRKYFGFMENQGFLNQQLSFNQAPTAPTAGPEVTVINQPAAIPFETLQATHELQTLEEQKKPSEYSSFPPIRLVQKLAKGSNTLFDLLILWPVVKIIVASKYQFWKWTGRQVFAPVGAVAAAAQAAAPINQGQPAFESLITSSRQAGFTAVSNLPKSLYAPVYLSLKDYPIHKKIVHHLRYTRPKWYKKYHSYAFVHYLHFAVFLVYTTILGLTIYQAYKEAHNIGAPVLAALPGSPPRMLAFEGKLTDATNTPITAEQTLRFGLYDSPTASASSLLWQETQAVQPDNNGKFKTLLGKSEPIYQRMLTENPKLFLGISIGPEAELKPRQQIATVNYSEDAGKVQGLAPITDPTAGTENVLLALDSGGDLIIGGSASPRFEATGGEFTLAGNILTLSTTEGTNGNVQIVPDGSGIVDIQKPIQNTTNYNNIPGVEGAVEFDDSVAILATTSAQSAFVINQNGTGDLISASASGIARFSVDYLGRGTFGSDLAVNGNNLTTISTNFNLLNRNVVNLNIGGNASNISIGSTSGQTAISNRLVVNNGLWVPTGKDFMLEGFAKGSIPFIGVNKELSQDTDNFVWAVDTKRLGLGTNSPLYRLDVRDGKANATIAQFYNADTSTDADGVTVKLGNTAGNVATSNEFIRFETAGVGFVGAIRGDGATGIQVRNGSFADWAEYMKKDVTEAIPYGSLLCLQENGTVTACTQSSGAPIGIASEHPTVIAGKDLGDATIPVGMLGVIKTRVTSLNGTIKPGDMIAASSQKGRGVKAIAAGTIIGRALEGYENTDPTETGTILVAVQTGWYDPTVAINQAGDVLAQSFPTKTPGLFDGIIETIKLGIIEANTISVKSLSIASDNISVGGVQLRDYVTAIAKETTRDLENQLLTRKLVSPIAEIAQVKTNVISPLAEDATIALQFDQSQINVINPKISSTSAVASIDNEGNASFSGTLRARRIIADEIQGLNIQAATVAANYITNVTNIYNIATPSAESARQLASSTDLTTDFADISDQQNSLTSTPTFNAEFAKFNQGLIALGGSSFTDVGISGTLRVGDTMRISDTSIDTIGTELALQPLRQGNLSIMGGLVMIDTEGNANFSKDVTVKGRFAANLIVPVPDQDLLMQLPVATDGRESKFEIQTGTGSAALTVNQYGDVMASGSGSFGNVAAKAFTIIRGVQADTSLTQTVAEGSGGTAVITANERERTIITPYMKANSLIYVTPTSQTYGVMPYIARQTANSFTIQIPYPITKDIKLNWWIVN